MDWFLVQKDKKHFDPEVHNDTLSRDKHNAAAATSKSESTRRGTMQHDQKPPCISGPPPSTSLPPSWKIYHISMAIVALSCCLLYVLFPFTTTHHHKSSSAMIPALSRSMLQTQCLDTGVCQNSAAVPLRIDSNSHISKVSRNGSRYDQHYDDLEARLQRLELDFIKSSQQVKTMETYIEVLESRLEYLEELVISSKFDASLHRRRQLKESAKKKALAKKGPSQLALATESHHTQSSISMAESGVQEAIGGPVTVAQAGCLLAYVVTLFMWIYAEFLFHINKPHQLTSHDDEKEEELVPIVVKSEASDNPNNGQTAQQPTLPKSPRSPTTSAPSYHSTFSTGFIQGSFLRIIALDPPTLLANRETLRACTEMGTIIVWFYLADRTPVIAAGPKEYIRDVFLSIFAVLTLVAGNYTMKKGRAPVLINRQQTEEWKGWMQVLFLLYHYYEAREVYNAIRIFIASYVWMTGFGNFAYYYKTRDFSMGRFCQMMWRLNLLAVLCCAALNNEYMLYYICPMHTLYTIMVYAALGLWKKGNDSTIGLAVKIILSFVVVIVVWEIKEVFYIIWRPFLFFLGYTDPRRPNPDAMHEWYFRTGLDRYIWIHGMFCAYMHPKFETWLKAVDEKSALVRRSIRAVLIVVAVTAGYLWYEHVYRLPKLQYNQVHPYTSWIPITAFLILRNMTPSMRLNSMGLYGWLGCITLETYIAQYHTWLLSKVPNSQPIYLVSFLPGYPLLNFGIVTALYIFISHRLFTLTAILRDAIIPHDNDPLLLKNLITIGIAVAALWGGGFLAVQLADAI